jgi:hypothetical protein
MSEPKKALPEIDFVTFVLSLASNALVHLGELPEGLDGDAPVDENVQPPRGPMNLPLAKQTIEILGMLEAKTKGNLDEGERSLLAGVLYDLRVKFVDAAKHK